MWVDAGALPPVLAVSAEGVTSAQHHGDPGGAVAVDGLWLRLLTMAALVVVAAVALLRPFVGDRGTRSPTVAVVAAFVAVIGDLALAPEGAGRLDPAAAVLPVVLVTTALAMLPVLDSTGRGRVSGYLAGMAGLLAIVLGTDPAAMGELLSGDWSGEALRASALAWVGALAWFALAVPVRPAGTRVVRGAGFLVAVAVVAAVPGFTAAGAGGVTTTADAPRTAEIYLNI
jgi:hypothetical protein